MIYSKTDSAVHIILVLDVRKKTYEWQEEKSGDHQVTPSMSQGKYSENEKQIILYPGNAKPLIFPKNRFGLTARYWTNSKPLKDSKINVLLRKCTLATTAAFKTPLYKGLRFIAWTDTGSPIAFKGNNIVFNYTSPQQQIFEAGLPDIQPGKWLYHLHNDSQLIELSITRQYTKDSSSNTMYPYTIRWEQNSVIHSGKGLLLDKRESLTGVWKLEKILNVALPDTQLFPVTTPWLSFDALSARYTGNAGCNTINGRYETKSAAIRLYPPLRMSRMKCPGEGETVFLSELDSITQYSVLKNSLLAYSGKKLKMRFYRKKDTNR